MTTERRSIIAISGLSKCRFVAVSRISFAFLKSSSNAFSRTLTSTVILPFGSVKKLSESVYIPASLRAVFSARERVLSTTLLFDTCCDSSERKPAIEENWSLMRLLTSLTLVFAAKVSTNSP